MTASLKLYETVDALDVVREWVYEHDEEIRAMEGALPDELAELLALAEGDFKAKAERVALFVRELLANASAVKIEATRLAARQKHYEKAAEVLKDYLQLQMEAAGMDKVEGNLCTVALQNSPPSLKVDQAAWPQERLRELYVKESGQVGEVQFHTVRHVPERFEFDARQVIELGTFGTKKKREYVAPLPDMAIEQGRHLRIR